jgi:hypothetical protein
MWQRRRKERIYTIFLYRVHGFSPQQRYALALLLEKLENVYVLLREILDEEEDTAEHHAPPVPGCLPVCLPPKKIYYYLIQIYIHA